MPTPDSFPHVALVAGQRCGTNALAAFLEGGGTIRSFGEVFREPPPQDTVLTPQDARNGNFFRFRQAFGWGQGEYLAPSRKNQKALWTAYVDHLQALAGGRLPLIDIKYDSFHHLNDLWYRVHAEPLLLTFLKNRGIPILHLSRSDLLGRALSYLIAIATQRWHWYRNAEAAPVAPVRLDPHQVIATMRDFAAEEQLYTGWLSGYRRRFAVRYEEAFTPDGRLAEATRAALSAFLRVEIAESRIGILKSPVAKTDAVANHDEIIDQVRAAGMIP